MAGRAASTAPGRNVSSEIAYRPRVATSPAPLRGRPANPYIRMTILQIYCVLEEVAMAKTLIDVDEQYLAAAQEALHTETKKDTVNAALREVAALAARRRDLQRLASGGLPDLEDDEVMRAAWRQ